MELVDLVVEKKVSIYINIYIEDIFYVKCRVLGFFYYLKIDNLIKRKLMSLIFLLYFKG